ncbi:hypothetical protein BX600DRAFT_443320 [Xylariales sp. PMI_506]|nr:hypothetical protein BX600DRAFT_443320 [Xylariales sp. PMI_506]
MTPLDDFQNTAITFMVLATPAFVGRVWLRASRQLFSYDDGFLVLAYTTSMAWCIMSLASLSTGLGSATASPVAEEKALKLFVIATFLNFFTMYFAKISLALVLYRMAVARSVTRLVILGSISLQSAWCGVVVIMYGGQCDPFPAVWGEPGTCKPASWTAAVGVIMSAMDIVFTFFYAILPIFMLWTVQISLRTKLGIYFLLGANIVTPGIHMPLPQTLMIEAAGSTYTTVDIGLTILLTSMAALKGLLHLIPLFGRDTKKGIVSDGKQTDGIDPYALSTLGSVAIRLDDRGDTESQEDMIPSPFQQQAIKKKVDYVAEFNKTHNEASKKYHV